MSLNMVVKLPFACAGNTENLVILLNRTIKFHRFHSIKLWAVLTFHAAACCMRCVPRCKVGLYGTLERGYLRYVVNRTIL